MKYTKIYALILLLAILLTSCNTNLDVNVKVPGVVQKPETETETEENAGTELPDDNTATEPPSDENLDENTRPDNYINDDITFDLGESVHIVINDKNNNNSTPLTNLLITVTDKWPVLMTDDNAERNNELVVGNCDRAVSRDAYRFLENMERESKYVSRIVIYSHGNSVAVAYDIVAEYEPYIVEYAINCLKEKYFTEGEPLNIGTGELFTTTLDLAEYQKNLDIQREKEVWWKFTEEAGEEAAEALRVMYDTLYDREALTTWIANLYDVDLGGFYYANSARDEYQVKSNGKYYDLLPDLESTSQALGFISSSGMIYGYSSVNSAFPEWMKTATVKFAKEKQDPNGYFYHPQWTHAMVDNQLSRRGRDLSSAVGILSMFNSLPTYNTPSGINGDKTLWDGTPIASSASALTLPIGTSYVASVSLVVAAAASVPSHMQDEASFRAYLKDLENDDGTIDGNSYWIGNQLASQTGQIVARDKTLKNENAGYQLADILAEWLDGLCYETTGHWEPTSNYAGLNGLMKISSAYEGINRPLPYPEAAVRSAIATIDTEETNSTVCFSYNSWFAIGNIISNVKSHRPLDEANALISSIRKELRENAAALITATMNKQGIFRREDGSFAYTVNGPSETSQGLPVVPKKYYNEGDVNATIICTTGTLAHMFNALGYSKVPILYRSDLNLFLDIVEGNREEVNSQYNYAETEEDINPELINYKLSTHTNTETGETAPVIKIYNSHLITDAQTQKAILRHIFNTDEGRAARLSEADIEYYIKEWNAHNYMYENPSFVSSVLGMTEEEVKARAEHVDLNTNDERRSIYESFGLIK